MGRKVKGKKKRAKKTAKIGRKIPDRFKHLQSQTRMNDTQTRLVVKEVKKINHSSSTFRDVEKGMDEINGLMGGFGVEAINEGSLNLLYVNMGDTYDTTIVYEVRDGKARVGDWGSYVEAVS